MRRISADFPFALSARCADRRFAPFPRRGPVSLKGYHRATAGPSPQRGLFRMHCDLAQNLCATLPRSESPVVLSMGPRFSREAARRQAAVCSGGGAAASISSRLIFFCLIPFGSHAQALRSIFFQLDRQCGSNEAATEQFSVWPEWTSFQWMMQLPRSPATTGHSPASSARQTRRARMQFASVASEGHSASDVVYMCCCSAHGS